MSRALALAAVLAAAVAGCAAPNHQAAPDEQIRTTLSESPGGFDVAADRGKLVYLEFLASPTMTAELRGELAAAGFQLASSRELATVTYEFDGAFQALRPATGRTAEVRAGVYAEQPGPLATTTGRGPSVMFSLNPVAMVLGTLFSNVGDRTGARDATNKATVGDPDGKCITKCDGWIYRQQAVVRLVRTEAERQNHVTVTSALASSGLTPNSLFSASYSRLIIATRLPFIKQFNKND